MDDLDFHCPLWPWVCEDYQRELLLDGFERAGGQAEDVVLISDVDEIPRASAVRAVSACPFGSVERPVVVRFEADHFWYSAHCRRTDKVWTYGPVAAMGYAVLRFGPAQLRRPYSLLRQSQWLQGQALRKRAAELERTLSTMRHSNRSGLLLPPATPSDNRRRADPWHLVEKAANLSTRRFMPFYPRLEPLDPKAVQTWPMQRAAWHYSYLMSPERITLKYRSAMLDTRNRQWWQKTAWWHYTVAMQCAAPQHPQWRFIYVSQLDDETAPRFALANRCRMRTFFRYARLEGASTFLSNDYYMGGKDDRAKGNSSNPSAALRRSRWRVGPGKDAQAARKLMGNAKPKGNETRASNNGSSTAAALRRPHTHTRRRAVSAQQRAT